VRSPARLLVTHWPVGIVAGASDALWKPTSGAATGSPGLQPFVDNGLNNDMITLRGVSTGALNLNGGGSHEGGTVVLVTGVGCAGTRTNRGESDDGYAGGPSYDQVMLSNVAALKSPMGGAGYANSICDARTDLGEVSTKCLSYGNTKVAVTNYNGSQGTQNQPLTPVLSPLTQYTNLFNNFVPLQYSDPTLAAAPAADATLTNLASKKSILDFALTEISTLQKLAPSDAKAKLQNHFDAITSIESQITNTINTRYPTVTGTGGAGGGTGGSAGGAGGRGGAGGAGGRGGAGGTGGAAGRGGSGGTGGTGTGGSTGTGGTGGTGGMNGCKTKPTAPPSTSGPDDYTSGSHGNYGTPKNGSTDDEATHKTVGQLHFGVLQAAFLCDIIRCGTFQWSPGTNHVAFKGYYPGDLTGIYQHHPVSHSVGSATSTTGTTYDTLAAPSIQYLFNIQNWYFSRTAENLALWKNSVDGFGNSLFDTTVIPFVTEVEQLNHNRSNMAAMIFGGKKLGFQQGQYKSGNFSINSFWGTIAQAFGYTSTASPLASPIAGLWVHP